MRRLIENRQDVAELVNDFYAKIRKDELLGPIFNGTIENWDEHLKKLTDFWDSILLGANNFTGRPMRAHFQVDKKFDYSITQSHFDRWLTLWFETVSEKFKGEKAEVATERAINIARFTFVRLYEARNNRLLY